MVGICTLVLAGGAGGKLLLEGRAKGRRRSCWVSSGGLLWESKEEGGVVEVAGGGTRRGA